MIDNEQEAGMGLIDDLRSKLESHQAETARLREEFKTHAAEVEARLFNRQIEQSQIQQDLTRAVEQERALPAVARFENEDGVVEHVEAPVADASRTSVEPGEPAEQPVRVDAPKGQQAQA